MKAPDKQSIDRTLKNIATAEEARAVIRWFSTLEGRQYLSTLMDKDENTIWNNPEESSIDHAIPSENMYEFIMKRIHRQNRKKLILRAAAILIPTLLLIGQFIYMNNRIDFFDNSGYEEVFVPIGERLHIVFQDGSKATLNSGSRMRYPHKFAFSERKVELEGEAFFEIASTKSRPFKVELNGVDVKVSGTSFDVKAYPDDSEILIALESGRISIDALSKTLAYLNPGEKAIYNKKNGTCKIIKETDISKNSAWKNNFIIFEHTPLSEVITTLSRYYNVDFILSDSTALQYSYTITTTKKEIQEILLELEKITPVKFTLKEQTINISMKK